MMREFNRDYIAVHDVTETLLVGQGPLEELGHFDLCYEEKEDTAAQCVPLDSDEAESL